MDENGNKKNNSKNTLIAVLLCCVMILQVVQIVQDNHISEELELQNGRIESVKDYVDSGILLFNNSAYYSIEDSIEELKQSLQKQNSIVEEVRFRRGSLKEDNRTGEVFFYVVLNKVEPDTQVKIQIDSDKYVSMERTEGSTFEGVYEADIFNEPGHGHTKHENCTVRVHIINSGGTVIEEIEEPHLFITFNFYRKFLANIDGSGNFTMGGYYENLCKGNICESTVKVTIEKEKLKTAKLVYEKNGKVIKEDVKPVTTTVVEFKNQLDVTGKEPIKAYIVCEDAYGYVYKKCVFENFTGQSSENAPFETSVQDGVYDIDGNIVIK